MRFLFIGLPILLFACHSTQIIEAKPAPMVIYTKVCDNAEMAIIKRFHFDGCTWILELPSGEQLEPINFRDYLTDIELENNQPIQIKVAFQDIPSASICMIGRTVTISCLERVK